MRRFAIALAVVVSMGATACDDAPPPPDWTDASEFPRPIVGDATEVLSTDEYRLLLGNDSSTVPGSGRCLQFVVRTTPVGCVEVDPPPNSSPGFSINVRLDDLRIVWCADTALDDPEAVADHFVVFSSLSPDGRRIDPIEEFGVTNLIWVMEPGEAPWGIQMIAGDGSLLEAQRLVGLPDR